MHYHHSCPECGTVTDKETTNVSPIGSSVKFDCPSCTWVGGGLYR